MFRLRYCPDSFDFKCILFQAFSRPWLLLPREKEFCVVGVVELWWWEQLLLLLLLVISTIQESSKKKNILKQYNWLWNNFARFFRGQKKKKNKILLEKKSIRVCVTKPLRMRERERKGKDCEDRLNKKNAFSPRRICFSNIR